MHALSVSILTQITLTLGLWMKDTIASTLSSHADWPVYDLMWPKRSSRSFHHMHTQSHHHHHIVQPLNQHCKRCKHHNVCNSTTFETFLVRPVMKDMFRHFCCCFSPITRSRSCDTNHQPFIYWFNYSQMNSLGKLFSFFFQGFTNPSFICSGHYFVCRLEPSLLVKYHSVSDLVQKCWAKWKCKKAPWTQNR